MKRRRLSGWVWVRDQTDEPKTSHVPSPAPVHVSYRFLKKGYIEDYIGEYYRAD